VLFLMIRTEGRVVTTALSTSQSFDEYAARYGWVYDNGGRYRDELWDWYCGDEPRVVLLRQGPDRVALIRLTGTTPDEIWSGPVADTAEFDRLMDLLAG
jgi:hypothetical protein